jgi:glycine betaine/choline ABC-type transport system substrate-binding protein
MLNGYFTYLCFVFIFIGIQNVVKKPQEKEFNIAAKNNNEQQILKNMQNPIKRTHSNNNNGGGKVIKPSSTVVPIPAIIL